MTCPKCATENPADYSYCLNCGHPLAAAQNAMPLPAPNMAMEPTVKKVDPISLVLALVGLVFAILFPLVAYPCAITGLVLAIKWRGVKKTTAALVLCIIALVAALINSTVGAILNVNGLL